MIVGAVGATPTSQLAMRTVLLPETQAPGAMVRPTPGFSRVLRTPEASPPCAIFVTARVSRP
jgi:hypothetical protein